MSPHLVSALILCFLVIGGVVDLVLHLARVPWLETWDFYYTPVWAILLLLIALAAFIDRLWLQGGLVSACAAIGVWYWWNNMKNRKRRRKIAARVQGRVVDLGGALGVRPVED